MSRGNASPRRAKWQGKSLAEKFAVIWLSLLCGAIGIAIVGGMLTVIIYAYIDLGFYHALPLTIGIVVLLLTFASYLILEKDL